MAEPPQTPEEGRFVEWLTRAGGHLNSAVRLSAPVATGRGVVALQDIKEGEQLLRVPQQLCLFLPGRESSLSGSTQQPSNAAAAYLRRDGLAEKLGPFLSTVLLLLHELALGEASCFWPYLQLLPAEHDCLLAWSDSERAELRGTMIEDADPEQLPAAVYEREVVPVMAAQPALWPAAVRSQQAFLRAAGLVQSRAFHLRRDNWITGESSEDEELVLIAGMDMLNHATDPSRRNTSLQKVPEPLSLQLPSGDSAEITGYFLMKAERDIPAGAEVLHTYGDLSDAELLQTYGFIDRTLGHLKSNPHNAAAIPRRLVIACCIPGASAAPPRAESSGRGDDDDASHDDAAAAAAEAVRAEQVLASKARLLDSIGLSSERFLVSASASGGGELEELPPELLTAVQVLQMRSEEVAEYALQLPPIAAATSAPSTSAAVASPSGGAPTTTSPAGSSERPAIAAKQEPYLLTEAFLRSDGAAQSSSRALFSLLKICDAALARYTTTLKDDETLLAELDSAESTEEAEPSGSGVGLAGEKGRRRRDAVAVRLGEKAVLRALKKRVLRVMTETEGGDSSEGGGGGGESGGWSSGDDGDSDDGEGQEVDDDDDEEEDEEEGRGFGENWRFAEVGSDGEEESEEEESEEEEDDGEPMVLGAKRKRQ